jgi:2-oxo-4-hydroxy-4-carboxy-5-ureidoimidazoline decarboxylase
MRIEDINALDRPAFVEALGWIFEDSPWVAARAWERRPFASLDALHESMVNEVARAAPEEQLALLRAHPDLGASRKMSAASEGEQSGAGLDRLSQEELRRLQSLNAAYRERCGFPFLFAVKGSTPRDVFDALVERSGNSRESEFQTALEQVYRIARFRLEG